SGPALPYDAEDLTRAEGEAHLVEHVHAPAGRLRESNTQVVDVEDDSWVRFDLASDPGGIYLREAALLDARVSRLVAPASAQRVGQGRERQHCERERKGWPQHPKRLGV